MADGLFCRSSRPHERLFTDREDLFLDPGGTVPTGTVLSLNGIPCAAIEDGLLVYWHAIEGKRRVPVRHLSHARRLVRALFDKTIIQMPFSENTALLQEHCVALLKHMDERAVPYGEIKSKRDRASVHALYDRGLIRGDSINRVYWATDRGHNLLIQRGAYGRPAPLSGARGVRLVDPHMAARIASGYGCKVSRGGSAYNGHTGPHLTVRRDDVVIGTVAIDKDDLVSRQELLDVLGARP